MAWLPATATLCFLLKPRVVFVGLFLIIEHLLAPNLAQSAVYALFHFILGAVPQGFGPILQRKE